MFSSFEFAARLIRAVPVVALVFCVATTAFLPVTHAQEGEQKPKAKMTDADLKQIRPLYKKAMEKGNVAGVRILKEALDKWAEKKKVGSPLADTAAWKKLFQEHYADRFKKGRAPRGGRVESASTSFKVKGEPVLIEYAYRLPKKYNPKEAWPVLLCFHDRKSAKSFSDGKTYLKGVFEANDAAKKLADKFIIVAPDVGDTTAKGKNASPRSFEWFDVVHLQAMVRPLKEIQSNFHVDFERIYLDGSGRGAHMALQLAALYGPETFAGVIARQGVLEKKTLHPGLTQVPTMLIHRKPHKQERGGAERAEKWQSFKAVAEEQKWPAEIVELDAPEKLNAKILAKQEVEPVWDLTEEVAAFTEKHRLEAYPAKFRIVTDNPYFRAASFVKITGHDIGREENEGTINVLFEVDRTVNAIRVTGDGIHGLSFFLNDDVLDLDRPVEVYVNGILALRKSEARSLPTMIRSMQKKPFDTSRFNSVNFLVEVPSPVEEKEGGDKKEDAE